MSIIEHTRVPAGWYRDRVANASLRWWDGRHWTMDMRPVAALALGSVAPVVTEHVPAVSSTIALTRRQLRELIGGPLVTDAPTDQRASEWQ